MNKLRPILTGTPSQAERRLLASSQLDAPPRNAKKRAFAVFGVGSSVIATAQVTGVASAAAAQATGAATSAATAGTSVVATTGATTGFALALVKGLAIGAVTGTIAYGSLRIHREHEPAPPATTTRIATREQNAIERTVRSAGATPDVPCLASACATESLGSTDSLAGEQNPTSPATLSDAKQPLTQLMRPPSKSAHAVDESMPQASSLAPEGARSVPHPRVATMSASAPPTPEPPGPPSLHAERAAIERAQALVQSGDPASALRTLTELQRRLTRPQLAPEAMLVRIDALLKLGHLSDARRLGSQFLMSQPDGPYAQRVRSLLHLPVTH